jgi:predicted PurR-regulated permease PerM
MKRFLVVFLVLICISFSAIAEPLTKEDIQSLEANMTKLQETVTDMDKRLTRLEVIVTEMDKRLSNQITEMDKRLSNQIAALDTFVKWAISVLVLVVLTVIALPQVFGYLRDKKEREALQKRVEQLEQEFAQFKTRMIAP